MKWGELHELLFKKKCWAFNLQTSFRRKDVCQRDPVLSIHHFTAFSAVLIVVFVYTEGWGKVKDHVIFVEALFICSHWQMDGLCVCVCGQRAQLAAGCHSVTHPENTRPPILCFCVSQSGADHMDSSSTMLIFFSTVSAHHLLHLQHLPGASRSNTNTTARKLAPLHA